MIFLLHFSDKVEQDRFNLLLSFIKNLLQNAAFDSGKIRVGAAAYGRDAQVLFNLRQYGTRADLMSGIDKIPYNYGSSYSNAAEGFRVVRDQMFTADSGDRSDAPNIVIMITDSSADNLGESAVAAESVRNNGIHIFGVGVELSDPDELEIYVSLGDANTFQASNYRGLAAVGPEIIQKVFAREYAK